jgi:hypothetical protein
MRSVSSIVVLALVLGACKRDPAPAPPREERAGQHVHDHAIPPAGPSVKVSLDGRSVDVAIASLATDGGASIPLASVWKAAWPAVDPGPLKLDLVGSDGFRSTSKPKCPKLLTGAELSGARLEASSHDVVLDEGSTLPGCYRVKAVVAIEASR